MQDDPDYVPANLLATSGFVNAAYPQGKRDILLNGLRGLRRIHAGRAWEDWLSVLGAFTMLTEEVVTELQTKEILGPDCDFRSVDTTKGSPFQRRFLPRWEDYEALLGSNHKSLSKAERGNLRELVKNPAILVWYAGLAPHRQRQMMHPNRVITAWKAANRSGAEEAAKPTLAKAQQRIILEQDDTIAVRNKRIAEYQKQLEDHDWNAAQELDQLTTALLKKLKTRSALEQAKLIKRIANDLGFADVLAVLSRRPS